MLISRISNEIIFITLHVKTKIYLVFLVLIFILSNFLEIDVEIISGIIYGLIYFFLLKTKLQIPDSFVQNLETSSLFKGMLGIKGFISISHLSSGLPVSITKVSNVDNEQEKEKLKGKGVIVAGSLDNTDNVKEEDEQETQKNETPATAEDEANLK